MRLFLAIPLPAGTVQGIETFQQTQSMVQRLDGFRWTPLANLHITQFFIGEVPEARVEELTGALRQAIAREQGGAFELVFDSFCWAPDRKFPRMLWARFGQHDRFSSLQLCIHEAVQPFVQSKPDKAPIPHITLSRFKAFRYSGQPALLPVAPLPDLRVDKIELWRSQQAKTGVYYEKREEFLLK